MLGGDPASHQRLSASVRRLQIAVVLAALSLVLAAGFGFHDRLRAESLSLAQRHFLAFVSPAADLFQLVCCIVGLLLARHVPRLLYRWLLRRLALVSHADDPHLSYRRKPRMQWAMSDRQRTTLEMAYALRVFVTAGILVPAWYFLGLHLASPVEAAIFGVVVVPGSMLLLRREYPTVDGLLSDVLATPSRTRKATRIDMAGRWRGEYQYGDGYPSGLPPVPFHMDLHDEGLGQFRGTVHDEGVGGVPELGQVRGRLTGTRLAFVKLLPVAHTLDDSGKSVPTRDYVLEVTGDDPGSEAHEPLQYEGAYDHESSTFRGEWHFEVSSHGSGTWWMRRESA